MPGPDPARARELYGEAAGGYDRRIARLSNRYRRRAVDGLQLRAGQSALDVACGTGANFELLMERVGPSGHVVGVDLSQEMLEIAAQRVAECAWDNIQLVSGAVEDSALGGPFDAALFSLTHDVLQSDSALSNVASHLTPDARVASFGVKAAPSWLLPVNAVIRSISRRYITTFDGFDEPWRKLARIAPDLAVEKVAFGGGYIASGSVGAALR